MPQGLSQHETVRLDRRIKKGESCETEMVRKGATRKSLAQALIGCGQADENMEPESILCSSEMKVSSMESKKN